MTQRPPPLKPLPPIEFRRLQRTLEKLKVIPDSMRGRPAPLPPSGFGVRVKQNDDAQAFVLAICICTLVFGFVLLAVKAFN